MKYFSLMIVAFAFICLSCVSAQRPYFQKLPYYPPPTRGPVYQRARRAAIGGEISTNPSGGNDAKVSLAQGFGTPDHNVVGQVFAAGNTNGKSPVTSGGALSYNNNGFGASIAKETIHGDRDILTKTLSANFPIDDKNALNANVFNAHNTLNNGFEFDRKGFGVDFTHDNRHSLGATYSKIPDFGSQVGVNGKANLWSSNDGNTRLDWTAGGSQWTSGPLSGQKNWNTGLGVTSFFG